MAEPMDDRYATFREHAELRERTATLEATLLQVAPTLARIETMVATKANTPSAPQETAAALALHRAADLIERGKLGSSGANPFLISLGTILSLVVGGLFVKFFL